MTVTAAQAERLAWTEDELDFGEPEAVKARRIVDTNGQVLLVTDDADADEYPAAGGGARQRPDTPNLGELAPGGAIPPSPGGEPPRWQPSQNLTAWSDQAHGAGRAGARPPASGVAEDWDDFSTGTHASHPEGGHDDRQGATGVPTHYTADLQGPGDGKWPQGGHGDRQPGGQSPGGMRGVPPSTVKAGTVESKVYQQLLENYPPKAITWVRDAEWAGPMNVPQSRIDDDAVKSWAASHQKASVDHFAEKISAGDPVKPAVSVQEPGESNVKVIDGHHRVLAYRRLGLPVKTYLGKVDSNGGPWDETHSSQFHQGSDPANKQAWEHELRGAHGEWMSADAAVNEYVFSGMKINSHLRSPDRVGIYPDLKPVIPVMDKAVKSLDSEMTTYRGVGQAAQVFGEPGSRVGKIFHDKGFLSSSEDKSTAEGFQSGYSGLGRDKTIATIHLKPGDKVIRVRDHVGSLKDYFHEVILPRETPLRIKSDAIDSEGVRQIELEVAHDGN